MSHTHKVCNNIQHMSNTVCSPGLSVYILCLFVLIFNRCNAILTDKLTRAKEEGLSVKQMLDQTLMEMVNI